MRVALIEFYAWHHECLYSQMQFLHASSCDVLLIADVSKQKYVEQWLPEYCKVFYFNFKQLSSFWKLRSLLKRECIDKIVLNTAQGSRALKFCLLPPISGVEMVGTIHNTEKLTKSFGQKLINRRIHKYYILADYLRHSIPKNIDNQYAVCYAVFLPRQKVAEIVKPQGECWISIPGYVEYKRRDYHYLLRLANALKSCEGKKRIKFIVLGNTSKSDGPHFVSEIREQNLMDYFVTFDSFVSDDVFNAYIEQSDAIMPLIHPDIPSADKYTKYKISGAFNLALSHNKVMLCHSMFQEVPEFNYPALFYATPEYAIDLITQLPQPAPTSLSITDFETNRVAYMSLLK